MISSMEKGLRNLPTEQCFKAIILMASQKVSEGMRGPTANFMKDNG